MLTVHSHTEAASRAMPLYCHLCTFRRQLKQQFRQEARHHLASEKHAVQQYLKERRSGYM